MRLCSLLLLAASATLPARDAAAAAGSTVCSGGHKQSWIIYCWLVWCERKNTVLGCKFTIVYEQANNRKLEE